MLWRVLAALVGLVPFRLLGLAAAPLDWTVRCLLRIRTAHALACIKRAGLGPADRIAAAAYRSLARMVLEFLWLAGRAGYPLERLVRIEPADEQRLRACLAQGRGLVVASAHTGNWELLACAVASRLPLAVVTRHMSWRSADRFWQQQRRGRGVEQLDGVGVLRQARARLSQGGVVAFMADQAPNRDRGVVIADFLGAPAAHDLSFALLATRCRAPLALVLAERLPDGVHKLHVPLIIEPSARPSRAAAVEACLQVNRALERFLRAQPGQWLWLHRRWRGGGEARAEARD